MEGGVFRENVRRLEIIREQRSQGIKIGLIKVRLFRPFPREQLVAALKGKQAAGVEWTVSISVMGRK